MCYSSRYCMRPHTQKSAPLVSSQVWISWAQILTQRAHILPSTKLSHPWRSCKCADILRGESGWRRETAVLVPLARRYDLITPTKLGPVCWSSNHITILSTASLKTDVHPRSWQCVMWLGNLSLHPQLGKTFRIFLVQSFQAVQAGWWFVLLKCEACFVTHTQNISGKDFMTFSIPFQWPGWIQLSTLYSVDGTMLAQPLPHSFEWLHSWVIRWLSSPSPEVLCSWMGDC